MRIDKIILGLLIIALTSCKTFTEVSTKDHYKSIWTGKQFRSRSCVRWVHETIKDTVANYVVQRTRQKRQICGFYGWPIKSVTTTYNKQGRPLEKHIVKRGRFDTKKINKIKTYPKNYNGMTKEQVIALKDFLNNM